ncbi:hypothetical protein [Butyribacter sp.]|uniref:hypothetical protein n=1 Tax=Butyribacter sp. TaxID=2822465 RepID=UPI002A9CF065|nr:hypothetical protein [Butyribacter sp.]
MSHDIFAFLDSAWSIFLVLLGIFIFLYNKITNYMKLTKEQKVEAALKVVKAELLKLMSDAEIEWQDFNKSGEIKKSQVISEIYKKFPFLAEYISQDELIEKIGEMIEEQKAKMDEIINNVTVEDVTNAIEKKKK